MKKRIRTAIALLAALAMVMVMSASAFADGVIGSKAAMTKALNNAGLKRTEVKYRSVEYDSEEGVYDVEFTKKKNGAKYEYELDAATGKIYEKSVDYKYKRNTSRSKIGKIAARKKVAKFSGISYNTIKKGTCRYEYDDREGAYEVKFTKSGRRYDYEVLAPTGKIIEYSWKVISR